MPQASPPGPPRRILVVDDNKDAADSLALLLQMRGHRVSVAHDGPAALAAASPELDFVLLDIGLPGMDGYAVARELRRRPDLGRMRIVALTGYGRSEEKAKASEAGFDRHLLKPVGRAELEKLLAEPLEPA
jgi:CheY-like chemotaxis protein